MVWRSLCWLIFALACMVSAQDESITLDELVSGHFTQSSFNGTWISDTEFTYTISGQAGIYIFDVSTLVSSVLVSGELMEFLNTTTPILSADRRFILAPSEVQQVYRHSRTARYALYEIETGSVNYIANYERLQLCIFGGGHSLAYVLDNNLYYLPENASEAIQVTTDGEPGVIYNGHADWVYEEDVMSHFQATWFSTDGNYLAYASYNDTLVETYSWYEYFENDEPLLYPKMIDLKYPKVGRVNPTVQLRVINLETLVSNGDPQTQVLDHPEDVTEDHILGGVVWPSATQVAAHWLNRRQNYTVLRICDVVSNSCAEEHRSQSNGWVPISMPTFSANGDFFVSRRWSLEQADGGIWQHLYLSMVIGNEIVSSSITPGAFTVDTFVGMSEEHVAYFYTRTLTNTPYQRHVYVSGSRDGCISCSLSLPQGSSCAWASATASTKGSYLALTCAALNEPSVVYLYDPINYALLYTWEDNSVVRERLEGRSRPQSFITSVSLSDGDQVPVRMYLPPGLDQSADTKYPMVFYVYSGPNTFNVQETFSHGYASYMAANRNVIYMIADGRGSALKGQKCLYAINNALGTVEIEDHFVILREVLDRFAYIDESRVGIWGHSYGGYATLLTLAHDDENMFKCGIAGAPVTSWLYYNTMYTERYMGLPTEDDNLSGYETGDVTKYVEKLQGKDFYIMHGNADDNVHYQNAVKLYTALQEQDIHFEQMSYPDEAHSLSGVNMHRYSTMDRVWNRCLELV